MMAGKAALSLPRLTEQQRHVLKHLTYWPIATAHKPGRFWLIAWRSGGVQGSVPCSVRTLRALERKGYVRRFGPQLGAYRATAEGHNRINRDRRPR